MGIVLPIDPVAEMTPAELRDALREVVLRANELLLELYDEVFPFIDPFEDMEEDDFGGPDYPDDEYTLGWCENLSQLGLGNNSPDAEPSLGGLHSLDQREWSAGSRNDREDEHDGREPSEDPEPGEDEEPSLGWPEDYTARLDPRALQSDLDPEHDDADLEDDGLAGDYLDDHHIMFVANENGERALA